MRLRIGTKIGPDDPMEDGMPVFTDGKELFRHTILLGKSGAGKTMMFENFQLLLDCKKSVYAFKMPTAGEPKEE